MTVTTAPRRATLHVREFLADSLTPLAVYRRLAPPPPVRFLFSIVTRRPPVSRVRFPAAPPRPPSRPYPDPLAQVLPAPAAATAWVAQTFTARGGRDGRQRRTAWSKGNI